MATHSQVKGQSPARVTAAFQSLKQQGPVNKQYWNNRMVICVKIKLDQNAAIPKSNLSTARV